MKSQRMLSIIMLIEKKKIITAQELSKELCVNIRTIYRDIEALYNIGIPIYSNTGKNGGYSIIKEFSSGLEGLKKNEIEALLSINIEEFENNFEYSQNLKLAFQKLLVNYSKINENYKNQFRIFYDTASWNKRGIENPFLPLINKVIRENRILKINYSISLDFFLEIEEKIRVYGLVFKENCAYIIFSNGKKINILNLSMIKDLKETNYFFEIPKDFDLKKIWYNWCADTKNNYKRYVVMALIVEEFVEKIDYWLSINKIPNTPTPVIKKESKYIEKILYFNSFEEARNKILTFGRIIKVLEPIALRYSIIDYAEQVLENYKK